MRTIVKYREFEISPSLVSYAPEHDWSYSHQDFDGAPDANDNRCGHAGSVEEAMAEIDEWHEENATSPSARKDRA